MRYEMRRGDEFVYVEHGEGALFYLVGTGVGITLDAWLEQGWSMSADNSNGLSVTTIQFIRDGKTIQAIKQHREDFPGTGLADAKRAVDAYRDKHKL